MRISGNVACSLSQEADTDDSYPKQVMTVHTPTAGGSRAGGRPWQAVMTQYSDLRSRPNGPSLDNKVFGSRPTLPCLVPG